MEADSAARARQSSASSTSSVPSSASWRRSGSSQGKPSGQWRSRTGRGPQRFAKTARVKVLHGGATMTTSKQPSEILER